MANKDDAHYWELVRVEMDNVYKMHLATVERSHSIIRQWGVVAAFPFVVMSFARVDGSLRIDLTGYIQDGGWVFFVAAGLFSLLFVVLQINTFIEKALTINAMNSFRFLHQRGLRDVAGELGWDYPIRTDSYDYGKLGAHSFTNIFAFFGGLMAGLYVSALWLFLLPRVGHCLPPVVTTGGAGFLAVLCCVGGVYGSLKYLRKRIQKEEQFHDMGATVAGGATAAGGVPDETAPEKEDAVTG